MISLAGLGIRLAYLFATNSNGRVPFSDAFYFHYQAKLIAEGKGFIDPFQYVLSGHRVVASAAHPPLWTLFLAAAAAAGLTSYLSHLVVACVVGAAAVFTTGVAGRAVAGGRVGIIAASIAAVYPNYWLNDVSGFGETLLLLEVALVVLVAYRLWQGPRLWRAVLLGSLCGLAALTRAEQIILAALVMIPVAMRASANGRQRLAMVGVGLAATVITIGPWVGFNLSRFQRPEFLSTEMGVTLAVSNCPHTYSGPLLGSWWQSCAKGLPQSQDESQKDRQYLHRATKFISSHSGRVPVVVLARVGRQFGLFHPLGEIQLERRSYFFGALGLFVYYFLVVMSAAGITVLLRRRTLLVPMVGLFVEVLLTSILFYGTTRFRVPLEVALVILSAVSLDVLAQRFVVRHRRPFSVSAPR